MIWLTIGIFVTVILYDKANVNYQIKPHGRQLRNASLRNNFWLSVTIQSFLTSLPVLVSFIFRTPIQLVLIKRVDFCCGLCV